MSIIIIVDSDVFHKVVTEDQVARIKSILNEEPFELEPVESEDNKRKSEVENGIKRLIQDYVMSPYGKNPFTSKDIINFIAASDKDYVITRWAKSRRFSAMLTRYKLEGLFNITRSNSVFSYKFPTWVDCGEDAAEPPLSTIALTDAVEFARGVLPELFSADDWDDLIQTTPHEFKSLVSAGYIIRKSRKKYSIKK